MKKKPIREWEPGIGELEDMRRRGTLSARSPSKIAAPSGAFSVAGGWTAPSDIPSDVARKIIAARDALVNGDTDDAWHQLYSIADPRFESVTPWANLEAQSNTTVSRDAGADGAPKPPST